jgi:hypothetical protein
MGPAGGASAAGPGGWDHLGLGPANSPSLNGAVRAFHPGPTGVLYVGGAFTDAGGNPDADRIAAWNGTAWSALSPSALGNDVRAIAYAGGKVYAGGVFVDAGGDLAADHLAVWDGVAWEAVCGPIGGNVNALHVIGSTMYVGGEFTNGGGHAEADYLLACDLDTEDASPLVNVDGHGTGAVHALTSDSSGDLFVAGSFINWAFIPAVDYVARYDGTWNAMGSGPGPAFGAVTGAARSITSNGTDVYLGTDALDVAGIAQADHVARWDGLAWNAVGSDTAGSNGWFPTTTTIDALTTSGSTVFAGGSFQNANGDPLADQVAAFDGSSWKPVGSSGAGNGPLNANVRALSVFNSRLHAGGNFTSAGGDPLAQFGAVYDPPAPPGNPAPISTPPPTPPLPLIPAGNPPLPPPQLAATVNAVPEKGTVLVQLPPGNPANRRGEASDAGAAGRFIPLSEARQVPLGSTFDTTRGTVRLTLATRRPGVTQDGQFSKGRFRTAQSARSALTTISATGGGLASCKSRVPRGGAARLQASRRSRSLFSNARGRFRTRGRNSSATVRGTIWLQKDTCAGTLTTVQRGSVVVRDFAKGRNVIVKQGKRYLARSPAKGRR